MILSVVQILIYYKDFIILRQLFVAYVFNLFAILYSLILNFLHNRKTPETLRFRGILRLDTMYLAVLNLFYIDRSANLDFASLHLGLGVRPINSPTNVLVWANSHRTLLCEFALLIACRILFDNCSNMSWSNSTSTFTFVRFLKFHYFLWFPCPYFLVLWIFQAIFLFSAFFSIKMVSQPDFHVLSTFRLQIPTLTVIIETWVLS